MSKLRKRHAPILSDKMVGIVVDVLMDDVRKNGWVPIGGGNVRLCLTDEHWRYLDKKRK